MPETGPGWGFVDAEIIDDDQKRTNGSSQWQQQQQSPPLRTFSRPQEPSQATPPITAEPQQFVARDILGQQQQQPEQHVTTPDHQQVHFDHWDKKLETAQTKSKKTLLRSPKHSLGRDPPGDSPDFPSLLTRVVVTMFAAVSTSYLHLHNGCSPVLASSAMTLLVSTCLDRRLGQAALCGSFAGMSGGHLVPNISMAMLLGALTSACYELLIHINNACAGIGGRLGATAFIATSIMAQYRNVGSVGRKLRRGLWKAGVGPSKILVAMMLYHTIGSVATIFLRECSDNDSAAADPVRASSIVGLLGSIFVKDPISVMALYGGSFVGMSLPSQLIHGNAPGKPRTAVTLFSSFAGAGAIAGLIHAATIHSGYWDGGWGGKAGLCAFAGCWIFRGFGNVTQYFNKRTT
jgi:hypothetical protein